MFPLFVQYQQNGLFAYNLKALQLIILSLIGAITYLVLIRDTFKNYLGPIL